MNREGAHTHSTRNFPKRDAREGLGARSDERVNSKGLDDGVHVLHNAGASVHIRQKLSKDIYKGIHREDVDSGGGTSIRGSEIGVLKLIRK